MNFEFDNVRIRKAKLPADLFLTQAVMMCYTACPGHSLDYWRNVISYNLGDGRQFPLKLIGMLIEAYYATQRALEIDT